MYYLLYIVFLNSAFFTSRVVKITKKSFQSVFLIFFLSIFGYALVFSIPNLELQNRILHAFSGGFLAFFICFLVVKDAKVEITKFQFCFFSFMLVTTLGVANEILELFLQRYAGFVFTQNIYDTWYDLLSNTVGSLVAACVFTPFISDKGK